MQPMPRVPKRYSPARPAPPNVNHLIPDILSNETAHAFSGPKDDAWMVEPKPTFTALIVLGDDAVMTIAINNVVIFAHAQVAMASLGVIPAGFALQRDEVGADSNSVEALRRELSKAKADAQWWWLRYLGKDLESRGAPAVKISSPLNAHEQLVNAPRGQGQLWSWYAASCPCCKRPIDLTVVRYGGSLASMACSGVSIDISEGVQLRVMSAPLPIWADFRTFESIGTIRLGATIVAAGPVEVVAGYLMVPIQPEGVIDGRFVEIIQDQACGSGVFGDDIWFDGGESRGRCDRIPVSPSQVALAAAYSSRYAYCAVVWGANAGYILGALVLGIRLMESHGGGYQPERVLLHTDDVPPNFVAALAKVWTVVKEVDYIDGAQTMHTRKGGCFDGVFTKLAAWQLIEYSKILLLDVDVIPLRDPDSLFELDTPAALVRGHGECVHGSVVDGRRFFNGDRDDGQHRHYAWTTSGGINAGVILLRPCVNIFKEMMYELHAELHPEHIPSPGPEQDYLTRYFAAAPWHGLDVGWNYQIHHVPFALEYLLRWRRNLFYSRGALSDVDREWLPPRLAISLEDVGIVHFSGDVKLWHLCIRAVDGFDERRRAVEHVPLERWTDTDSFTELFMRGSCPGYARWVERMGSPEDYSDTGCVLLGGGKIELRSGDVTEDVTSLVDRMVERLRDITRLATNTWRHYAERLVKEFPSVLEDLSVPEVPACSYAPGTRVQVRWLSECALEESEEIFNACVTSVHKDGRCVVRYDSGGSWGDTEREVSVERISKVA